MSKLTEERLFKDFARELHKVAPSVSAYHIRQEYRNPITKQVLDLETWWVVGSKRYGTPKPAILDMMLALRMAKVNLPDALHKRLVDVYGGKT